MNNSGTIFGLGTYTQTAGQTINNGILFQESIHIDGGSLSGTGGISGNDVIIGNLASVNPGNSTGTMTIGGNFTSGGTLVFEIGGRDPGLYDVLSIDGNVNFTGGHIQFDFINGFYASIGDYWDFLLFPSLVTGWDTLNFTVNGLDNELLGWNITQVPNAYRLTIGQPADIYPTPTAPVPEPSTYAMLLAGLGLVGFTARRRKQNFTA